MNYPPREIRINDTLIQFKNDWTQAIITKIITCDETDLMRDRFTRFNNFKKKLTKRNLKELELF
jgi:hypothetical protein